MGKCAVCTYLVLSLQLILLFLMFFLLVFALRKYFLFFFFYDTATTEIYTLSLHDALPIFNDFALLIQNAREGIGAIALVINAFIPVMKGRGAGLSLDRSKVGIFARGLIKMSVNTDTNPQLTVGISRLVQRNC